MNLYSGIENTVKYGGVAGSFPCKFKSEAKLRPCCITFQHFPSWRTWTRVTAQHPPTKLRWPTQTADDDVFTLLIIVNAMYCMIMLWPTLIADDDGSW